MSSEQFIKVAKEMVLRYVNDNRTDIDDIFTVWYCKTLQNHKGLFGAFGRKARGLYFEVTFNGDASELYLDVYDKIHNETIDVE